MSVKQTRRALSVRQDTYEKLSAYAEATGTSRSAVLTAIVEAGLEQGWVEPEPGPGEETPRWRARRRTVKREAAAQPTIIPVRSSHVVDGGPLVTEYDAP